MKEFRAVVLPPRFKPEDVPAIRNAYNNYNLAVYTQALPFTAPISAVGEQVWVAGAVRGADAFQAAAPFGAS